MAPSEPSPGIAENHLRAVGLQNPLALLGGVGRQHELHLVPAVGADHGVGDAGVAAGGIENRAARGSAAGALAIENHIQRRAVFHRSAGVEVLGLGEDLDAGEFAGIRSRRSSGVLPMVASSGSASVRARCGTGRTYAMFTFLDSFPPNRMRTLHLYGSKGITWLSELAPLYHHPKPCQQSRVG